MAADSLETLVIDEGRKRWVNSAITVEAETGQLIAFVDQAHCLQQKRLTALYSCKHMQESLSVDHNAVLIITDPHARVVALQFFYDVSLRRSGLCDDYSVKFFEESLL